MSNGVYVEVSNKEPDDHLNYRYAITGIHPDGTTVRWTLPERLLLREELWPIVQEELVAELNERSERRSRITGLTG